jgi:hypothetical protein
LGAILLWRFADSYLKSVPHQKNIPLQFFFLPLPMIWHETTFVHIWSTQIGSGLRRFAAKFNEPSTSQLDILLDLNRRAYLMRSRTLESLQMALKTGLIVVDQNGTFFMEKPLSDLKNVNQTTKKMCSAAEKLGSWFGPLSIKEISSTLHINF